MPLAHARVVHISIAVDGADIGAGRVVVGGGSWAQARWTIFLWGHCSKAGARAARKPHCPSVGEAPRPVLLM